jgi:hypothetical protein
VIALQGDDLPSRGNVYVSFGKNGSYAFSSVEFFYAKDSLAAGGKMHYKVERSGADYHCYYSAITGLLKFELTDGTTWERVR